MQLNLREILSLKFPVHKKTTFLKIISPFLLIILVFCSVFVFSYYDKKDTIISNIDNGVNYVFFTMTLLIEDSFIESGYSNTDISNFFSDKRSYDSLLSKLSSENLYNPEISILLVKDEEIHKLSSTEKYVIVNENKIKDFFNDNRVNKFFYTEELNNKAYRTILFKYRTSSDITYVVSIQKEITSEFGIFFQNIKWVLFFIALIVIISVLLTNINWDVYNSFFYMIEESNKRLNDANLELLKLKKAIETTSVGITISDRNGEIIYVNPAEANMHGYRPEELIGLKSNIFASDTIVKNNHHDIDDWKIEYKRISLNKTRDNKNFPVYLVSDIIRDNHGEVIGFITTCEDISEKIEIQNKLIENETRYRLLFSKANDAIFLINNGKIVDCNEKAEKLIGNIKKNIVGKSIIDFSPATQENGSFSKDIYGEFFSKEDVPFNWRFLNTSSLHIETICNISVINYVNEDVENYLSFSSNLQNDLIQLIVKDVTDKLMVEKELRKSEERFRETFEQAVYGMAYLDSNLKIIECNKKILEILKPTNCKDNDGFIVTQMVDFLSIQDFKKIPFDMLKNKEMDKFTSEFKVIKKDYKSSWTEITVSSIFDKITSKFKYFMVIVEDINSKKETEETQILLTRAIESLPVGITISDENGSILYVNGKDAAMHEYTVDELIGQKSNIFAPNSYRMDSGRDNINNWDESTRETINITKSGREFPVRLFSSIIRGIYYPGVKVVTVCEDITIRKEHEEKLIKQNEQLKESNMVLENYAYAAAHDLRSAMGGIIRFTEKLTYSMARDSRLKENEKKYLDFINSNAYKMNEMIDASLRYAKIGQSIVIAEFNIREMLQSLLLSLKDRLDDVNVFITDNLPTLITGDESTIRHVFLNLIENSIKFSKGNLIIEIGYVTEENAFYVKDNGIGIQEEYKDTIFKLFQRLKPESYDGTGLGLAIVKRVVTKHGGRIWVDSGENEGACFYFTLS